MFDKFGRPEGYGQTSPFRDVSPTRTPRQPGRPRSVIEQAIQGPLEPPKATFRGAVQTLGAPSNLERFTNGNTGIGGNLGEVQSTRGQAAPELQAQPAPASPDYTTVGQYASRMHGYDPRKLADASHTSPKYQIGRVLSHFNPAEGLTPELVSALNTLNIADFSGEADKLRAANLRHSAYNPQDTGGLDDIITRFSGQGANPMWGAYTTEMQQAQRAAKHGGGGIPNLQQAITGVQPTLPGADGFDGGYAERVRQQVMAALLGQPGLAELAKMFGV